MSFERYPIDTQIDSSDFNVEHCQDLVSSVEKQQYYYYYEIFSNTAREAVAGEDAKKGKIYWLLADACSLMLSIENSQEPFKPFIVWQNSRSAIVDDFAVEDVVFFSEIVEQITNPRLQARLADIVWFTAERREVKYALIAIDSYRRISLATNSWIEDGRECWYRAFALAKMLRKEAKDRVVQMKNEVLDALFSCNVEDGYLALWLSELLAKYDLGYEKSCEIAGILERIAREFEGQKLFHRSRDYYQASALWYNECDKQEKSLEMTICLARVFENEAIDRLTSEQPSYLVAAEFYEKAIQVLRTVPNRVRSGLGVDLKLKALQQSLRECGLKAQDEMKVSVSDPQDITEMTAHAREVVSNLPLVDALREFAGITGGVAVERLKKSALHELQSGYITSMINKTHYSLDGRVVGKTPGVDLNDELDDENQRLVNTMIRHFGFHQGIATHGMILPALEVLHSEHRLSESDLLRILRDSPFVPFGRESIVAKGLYAGYNGDFMVALHLLAPQVENLVRYHLQVAKAKTTTVDSDGIETVNSLNSLVKLQEMHEVFGANITFEIRALFCEPTGPNIRNEIAHGLVEPLRFTSHSSVYAWWFVFRIVFQTFWSAKVGMVTHTELEEENHD